MVVAPSVVGVKVAVYTVDELAAKLDNEPPVTVISPTTKSVVASLDVKVNNKNASPEVAPSLTADEMSEVVAVMVIVAESVLYLLFPP